MLQRIAAIDLGTNSARLLIADLLPDGSFRQVLLDRTIVRLGGNFSRETGLSVEAMQRTVSCLKRFAGLIDANQVSTVRAVATSAVRDAVNGKELVRQVALETGLKLHVIDGQQEARLSLAGVFTGLDQQPEQLLLFDVGGGSTEYTVARGACPVFTSSLPLGVVRLTEGKPDIASIQDKINRELTSLQQQLQQADISVDPDAVLVGTAGTATTLAAISLQMSEYDYRLINNQQLSRQEVERIYQLLLPLTPSQRLQVVGLEKGREDLIIAGCLITMMTMDWFGFNSLKVCDYSLLEGLIVSPPSPQPA